MAGPERKKSLPSEALAKVEAQPKDRKSAQAESPPPEGPNQFKKGLYQINQYKPRIACTCLTAPVPALPPFLLSQESTGVQAGTSDTNCYINDAILIAT